MVATGRCCEGIIDGEAVVWHRALGCHLVQELDTALITDTFVMIGEQDFIYLPVRNDEPVLPSQTT